MLAALLAQRSAPPTNALSPRLLSNFLSKPVALTEGLGLPPRKAYDTQLSPDEEFAYRAWMLSIGHTPQAGFAVDDNFTGQNYDYRGYFKKYGPVKLGEQDHLTDEFKLPTHPSFSNESIYGQPGMPGAPLAGSWQGEQYTPSLLRYIHDSLRKK